MIWNTFCCNFSQFTSYHLHFQPIRLVLFQSGLRLRHCPTLFTPWNVVCDIFGNEYRAAYPLPLNYFDKAGW